MKNILSTGVVRNGLEKIKIMKKVLILIIIFLKIDLYSQCTNYGNGTIHRDTAYFRFICTEKIQGNGIPSIDTLLIQQDKVQSVFGNSYYVQNGTGLILVSPNGIRWYLTISDNGTINIKKEN